MAFFDELDEWARRVKTGMESPLAGPIVQRNDGKENWQFRINPEGNIYMHSCKGKKAVRGGKFYTWVPA